MSSPGARGRTAPSEVGTLATPPAPFEPVSPPCARPLRGPGGGADKELVRPRLVLVCIPTPDDDVSDVSIRQEERLLVFRRLGERLGLDLVLLALPELLAAGAGSLAERFSGARAAWWFGRIARLGEIPALVSALAASLPPGTPIVDDPDDVDAAGNLVRSYPRLMKAGVPQARTRFVPLSPAEWALPEAELEPLLAKRLAAIPVGPGGVFFRTYLGTRKINPGLNRAESREELVSLARDLVVSLRVREPILGLAVREVLPIAYLWDDGRRVCVNREFRVFLVDGEPAFLALGRPVHELRGRVPDAWLARVAGLEPGTRERLLELARRVGKAFRARLVAADFAVLESGEPVLIETNEGYCSGWTHPAACVAVFGQLLRRLAGLPPLSPDEAAALAREAGLDLWGLGVFAWTLELGPGRG